MTSKRIKNWDKNKADFLILKKLIDNDKLETKDFELSKFKSGDSREHENSQSGDLREYLPHSTNVGRLKELVLSGCIIKSKEKRKNGTAHIYKISIIGVIRLLKFYDKKEDSLNLTDIVKGFFPDVFRNELIFLNHRFTNKQLFKILTDVCANTTIEMRRKKKKRVVKNTKKNESGIKVPDLSYWFYIENRNLQINNAYSINKYIIFRRKEGNVSINEIIKKFYQPIMKIIIGAFFHELLIHCMDGNRSYDVPGGDKIVKIILERLRRNRLLQEYYTSFLQLLKNNVQSQKVVFENIEKLLLKKQSVFTFRTWEWLSQISTSNNCDFEYIN